VRSVQASVWKPLPSLVFGVLSTMSGLLYIFLPETLGQALPDTVEQAERFQTTKQNGKIATADNFVIATSYVRKENPNSLQVSGLPSPPIIPNGNSSQTT